MGCLKNINSIVVDIDLGISYEFQNIFITSLMRVYEGHSELSMIARIQAKVFTTTI